MAQRAQARVVYCNNLTAARRITSTTSNQQAKRGGEECTNCDVYARQEFPISGFCDSERTVMEQIRELENGPTLLLRRRARRLSSYFVITRLPLIQLGDWVPRGDRKLPFVLARQYRQHTL